MRGSLICVSTLNFVISALLKLGAAAVKITLKSEGHQFNQYVTIKQNIVSIGHVNNIPTIQFFTGRPYWFSPQQPMVEVQHIQHSRACLCVKLSSHYSPVSNNQLAVLATE